MITYLYNFFRKITPNGLERNAEIMMTHYDLSLSITSFFTQVENIISYTEVGGAYFTAL